VSETILITGFEPFGGMACNPTMDIVAALHGGRVDGRQVVGRILPVVYEGHLDRLKSLVDEVDPAVVIGFGLDTDADCIQIETRGVNHADFTLADNAGVMLKDASLEAGGSAYRLSTFPYDDIRAALEDAHIGAKLSSDAGRYLCNATLFHLLALAARRPQPPLCGFIHVPHASEHLAASPSCAGPDARSPDVLSTGKHALDLDVMIDAARIILRETSMVVRRDFAGLRPYDWRDDAAPQIAAR
jgi:pyroglutamyl-peptidase